MFLWICVFMWIRDVFGRRISQFVAHLSRSPKIHQLSGVFMSNRMSYLDPAMSSMSTERRMRHILNIHCGWYNFQKIGASFSFLFHLKNFTSIHCFYLCFSKYVFDKICWLLYYFATYYDFVILKYVSMRIYIKWLNFFW